MTPVAFCERESDLAEMTILMDADGTLHARRRLPSDVVVEGLRVDSFDDVWTHVGSQGVYARHGAVLDLDLDPDGSVPSYDYSALAGRRRWLRTQRSWHDVVDGIPRFRRTPTNATAPIPGARP